MTYLLGLAAAMALGGAVGFAMWTSFGVIGTLLSIVAGLLIGYGFSAVVERLR